MNAQSEPTKSPASPEKPNHFRLALLLALAVVLGARTVLSETTPITSGKKEAYQSANSVLEEVHQSLRQTPCRFPDETAALARIQALPASIPSWQQTARVESSELLRSLQRIAETMNCPHKEGREAAEVGELRAALEKQLEQDVRALFARLRRAQREEDREGAARNVSELLELLRFHKGPLRAHFLRLQRRSQDS